MRIAVLLYGRILHYKEHYENMLDIFGRENEIDFFLSHDPALNEDVDDFIRMYKPKAVCDDPITVDFTKIQRPVLTISNLNQEESNTPLDVIPIQTNISDVELAAIRLISLSQKIHISMRINNYICQHINKMRVYTLCENYANNNKIEYDYVISYRIDIFTTTPFCFDSIPLYTDATLYIPRPEHDIFPGMAINDRIAVGSLQSMNIYIHMFDSIESLLQGGCMLHPEILLYEYIKGTPLDVRRFELENEIIR